MRAEIPFYDRELSEELLNFKFVHWTDNGDGTYTLTPPDRERCQAWRPNKTWSHEDPVTGEKRPDVAL